MTFSEIFVLSYILMEPLHWYGLCITHIAEETLVEVLLSCLRQEPLKPGRM